MSKLYTRFTSVSRHQKARDPNNPPKPIKRINKPNKKNAYTVLNLLLLREKVSEAHNGQGLDVPDEMDVLVPS
jgi:hypothetical protein